MRVIDLHLRPQLIMGVVSVQGKIMLGIPQTDVKRKRQALYAYLAVYRRYRQQLAQGWSPKFKPSVQWYEKAMDPDLIRRQGPELGVGGGMTPDEYREAFVSRVDRKVDRLPPYGLVRFWCGKSAESVRFYHGKQRYNGGKDRCVHV